MPYRALCALFLLAAAGHAAIWPDQIAGFTRKPSTSLALPDRPLYDEFGFEATEQADYAGPAGRFTATAWRMKDSTGALALFEARRPSGAKASKLARLCVTTEDGVMLAYGNYVLQFTGHAPSVAELNPLLGVLPRLEQSALPALMTYLPDEGLVPNSERYVLGPVSLERFDSRVPPSVAAFHLGAEAQFGTYRAISGEMKLAIFSYPTPSIARERADAFGKLPGAIAKRTGSLVALIISPPDADEAERLLAKVNHNIQLTWNESPNDAKAKGFLGMVGQALVFSGVMMVFCLVVGIAFGGLHALRRRLGNGVEAPEMISLGLDGK